MPKRISKSKNMQIATQKQIVNVVVGKGKGKAKRRPSKQTIDDKKVYSLPLSTGVEASTGLFVRSGYIPITQTHSQIGGRVNKYVIPTENAPQIIRSFPEPRQPLPGQEPQAYDYGFEDIPTAQPNPSAPPAIAIPIPPAFNENMQRRIPVNMENIPIPQQGLYTTPIKPLHQDQYYRLGDPAYRRMDSLAESLTTPDYRPTPYEVPIVSGVGGGGPPSVKSQDKYMPKNSPYEKAEFK